MLDAYTLWKVAHLIAMTAMVGATIINGILHLQAKSSTPQQAETLLRAILRINRLIMLPSLLAIPITGYFLANTIGYALTDTWLLVSAILTLALIAAFWIGAIAEKQLHVIAADSETAALGQSYHHVFKRVAPIGTGALLLSIVAIVLMVGKPVL